MNILWLFRNIKGTFDYLSKSEAGGLKCLPLLLFGLGIVLVVDLQGLLLYSIKQR